MGGTRSLSRFRERVRAQAPPQVKFLSPRRLRPSAIGAAACYCLDDSIDRTVEVRFKLMLPNPHYQPFSAPKLAKVTSISRPIHRDLGLPERRQLVPPPGKIEPVPEVAIDKDRSSVFRQRNIGPARQ